MYQLVDPLSASYGFRILRSNRNFEIQILSCGRKEYLNMIILTLIKEKQEVLLCLELVCFFFFLWKANVILTGIQKQLFYVVHEAILKARYVLTSGKKNNVCIVKWYWHNADWVLTISPVPVGSGIQPVFSTLSAASFLTCRKSTAHLIRILVFQKNPIWLLEKKHCKY